MCLHIKILHETGRGSTFLWFQPSVGGNWALVVETGRSYHQGQPGLQTIYRNKIETKISQGTS